MTGDGVYEIKPSGRVLTRHTINKAVATRHRMSSDLSLEYLSTQQDGNWYAAQWRATGTHNGPIDEFSLPASGRSFTVEGASIGVTEGGKIKRHTEYWNMTALLDQIGISPPSNVDWGLASATYTDNPEEDG